ncbi:hypothetical protein P170DRAFT_432172 [Aspergillus steynii IBT 23096]|uniref:Uncharacterized protein n=1 Tax=Aspergillus steynii IBT 23096 TaxID=1392250 RepID=A0A2I2GNT3_9EURO|nr:uncharacterized protein P170DRAFT_432172 [Aspergillus steynii IBT 23096]PLB54529.1 hypothetical protein P170DRAFT_432172 [Aspergillus steynii IBT 23096]
MTPGFLDPLAVFRDDPQSQQYIRSVRNSVGAGYLLVGEPATTVIETTFDLSLKITYKLGHRPGSNTTPSDIESVEMIQASGGRTSGQPLRHYRIFSDYRALFIWRRANDIGSGEDSNLKPEQFLSRYPPAVHDLYDTWVRTFLHYFTERFNEMHEYPASVFPTVLEEIAWCVAGYLLAWRIAMGDGVGGVEFSAGDSTYLLAPGREKRATLEFLTDQARLLSRGEFSG